MSKRIIIPAIGAAAIIIAGLFLVAHTARFDIKSSAPFAGAPASQPEVNATEALEAQPIVEFRDRSTLQFLSVWDPANSENPWTLDGAPLPGPTTRTSGRDAVSTQPSERVVMIHYQAHADGAMKFRWFYFDAPIIAMKYRWSVFSAIDGEGILRVVVPADMQAGDLQVGEALGGWFTQVQADVKLAPTTNVSLVKVNGMEPAATTQQAHFSFGEIKHEVMYEKPMLTVEVFDSRTAKERLTTDWEVAALGTDKKRYRWFSYGYIKSGGKLFCLLPIPKEKVASVMYQTRKIEWHTLSNVAFRPRSASTQPAPQL